MSIMLTDVLKNMEEPLEKVATEEVTTQEGTPVEDTDTLIKQAEAEGRAMALGFIDELEKAAVETHPVAITPDHGQIPGNVNPNMQMSTAGGAVGSPATAVINSLISQAGHNGGVVQGPAGTLTAAKTEGALPQEAADVMKAQETAEAAAKTAGDRIIEALYNLHLAE